MVQRIAPRFPAQDAAKLVFTILAVAAIYYAAARLGLVLAFEQTNASPVWPPSGIAVALAVLLGHRIWPGIFLGALLANYVVFAESLPLPSLTLLLTSSGIATGNTLEALSGAWLLQHLRRAGTFPLTSRGVLMFAAIAGAVSLISSLLGSTTLWFTGLATAPLIYEVWFTWWLGDTTGILIIVPLILAWVSAAHWKKGAGWWLELGMVTSLSALVSVCVFSDWLLGGYVASLPYIVLPFLVWAAYRFGIAGATSAIAVVATIATVGTVYQHGAFGSSPSHSALVMLQLFIGVITITTLLLGTATEERNSHQRALRQANSRLEERSRELEQSNRELESFSYSVSHDLRAPLRAIDGFAAALCDDCAGTIGEQGIDYLRRIRSAAQRMGKLIDDMLELARVTRIALHRQSVDLSAMAEKIIVELRRGDRQRDCRFECDAGLSARVDPRLFRLVIENLIGNAWKYTAAREDAWIHFGSRRDGNKTVFFVEDNGVGFDMRYADKLFSPFQRLHGTEFEGTGIGLASVARIIRRHGGDYRGTGEVGKGACFYFTVSDDGGNPQTRTAARPPAGGPTEVSRLVATAPEQPKHLQG